MHGRSGVAVAAAAEHAQTAVVVVIAVVVVGLGGVYFCSLKVFLWALIPLYTHITSHQQQQQGTAAMFWPPLGSPARLSLSLPSSFLFFYIIKAEDPCQVNLFSYISLCVLGEVGLAAAASKRGRKGKGKKEALLLMLLVAKQVCLSNFMCGEESFEQSAKLWHGLLGPSNGIVAC